MTVRRNPVVPEETYPQVAGDISAESWTTRPGRSPEALAFDHEHGRLYEALKRAEELAEICGHRRHAAELRRQRAAVMEHIGLRWCGE